MEIKIKKDLISVLLDKAQNIVEKRNTMPILVNALLEAKNNKLKIYATDLEVSLTDEIECEVKKEGKVAVDAKNLYSIIRELNDDGLIQLKSKENNWLIVQQGKAVFNIVGKNPEEYPVFPTFHANQFLTLKPELLRDMIEKSIYSVSNDETRYHLNGVYFEQIKNGKDIQYRMVATDGHRLSLIDRSVEGGQDAKIEKGVIIPRKGLFEIKKLLELNTTDEISMAVDGPQLIIRQSSTILMIRLIEGKYPNFMQLMPKQLKRQVLASKAELLTSLKRVSLLSNKKSKGVTLSFSNGYMTITSNNPELGDAKEEVQVNYTGEDMKIGFNARYLLDILNAIEEDEVKIELNDQLSPGIIRPSKDADYRCLVMPMRI